MSLRCGIVGLPDVGKPPHYHALTKAGIAAENHAFCTTEPDVGIVGLPDRRLDRLAEIARPEKLTPAAVEFVDIAGLVAGGSKVEGSYTFGRTIGLGGIMKRSLKFFRFIAGAFLASIVAGCGSMQPGSGPLSLDPVRMVNAIATDDVGYVRRAVESKVVTVNQLIPAPAYMEGTPLITVAARAGALDVLHYLIKAGADVNARTPAVETPLMLAAFFGVGEDGAQSFARHEKAVRMLVSAGAAVENAPHHYTALAYAAYKGRDETLRYLLERGARVNANVENGMTYVNTPLMMAAIMGQFDTAVMLLNAGADPRVRKRDGPTARDLAVKYQHERLARVLACAERLAPGEKLSGKCS